MRLTLVWPRTARIGRSITPSNLISDRFRQPKTPLDGPGDTVGGTLNGCG